MGTAKEKLGKTKLNNKNKVVSIFFATIISKTAHNYNTKALKSTNKLWIKTRKRKAIF